jgi:hypothetical protein
MIGTRRVLGGLLLVVLMIVGCAGERTGTVEGTVKYEGQPIPKGTVTFHYPVGGGGGKELYNAKSGVIKDGTYKVENVPAGDSTITVMTTDFDLWLPKDDKGNVIHSPDYVALPKKYAARETSPLKYTVTGGPQKKDLELDSK